MSWRRSLALCLLALGACQRTPAPSAPAAAPAVVAACPAPPPEPAPAVTEPLPPCQDTNGTPLAAAVDLLQEERYAEALSCAAQASAQLPDSATAHSVRGEVLSSLGHYPEAQLAFARALALDPGHEDALLGAAHLYVILLPSTRENDELGVLYAERGLSSPDVTPELMPRFALVSAMAHNDLGRPGEALKRARIALAREPKNPEALYEKAVALFELCRFSEARAAFAGLLTDADREASAHYYLGLLLEREARWAQAQEHFDKARTLSPEDFPSPPTPTEAAFRDEVARAVAALPEDMRRDLTGVPVNTASLPDSEDLLSGEPPLSPAILGLFRGPSLGEPCDDASPPCRSVTLFRLNLARAASTPEELREQIRVTLLHEVGHLRGEDDEELAARGLE